MFSSRGWMRFALVCNLIGAALLFLAFQATASNFRLVTDSEGDSALCVKNRTLVIAMAGEGGWRIGANACPEFERAKPVAVVTLELPWLAYLGFILTLVGFTLQFLAIPPSEIIRRKT